VRDGIQVLKAGRPVIVFAYDRFERAARAQAAGLGIPDLLLYVYPQFAVANLSAKVEEEKALIAAKEFPKLLLSNAG
jgi:hypothetical protein